MNKQNTIHTVNRFVFVDWNNGIFFEKAIDIYKNGVFYHRVPSRHKDIMIKLLKSKLEMNNGS